MLCLLDYVKICGILIILMFLLKYLIPKIGYIEAFIISLIFVTVFTVLTTKTVCKNSSERFTNNNSNQTYSLDKTEPVQEYIDSNDIFINKSKHNVLSEKQDIDKIKNNNRYTIKTTDSQPINMYGYTFLPPENWFKPYEYPIQMYKYKESVVPVQDKMVEGLLGVDFTGPLHKINTKYLSNYFDTD